MYLKKLLPLFLALAFSSSPCATIMAADTEVKNRHPYVFHLVQKNLWEEASSSEDQVYYPPTYKQDGFTHGTANPEKLLTVANHFYKDVPGDWLCLRMTVDSLKISGVVTVFEGTAPVGDKPADFDGNDDELYPHILGGISPMAVIDTHKVFRAEDGVFTAIEGVATSNGVYPKPPREN